MSRREVAGFRNIDWMTFSLYISMVIIGWMMIYAAGYEDGGAYSLFNLDIPVGKQTMWISFSILILLITTVIDWKFWRTFSYFIYAFALVLLIGVLFFGVKVKGATSWIRFGGFTLQPSEFAKFATCLAMASYLSAFNTNLSRFRHQVVAALLFLLPVGLILMQPDAGSAIVFFGFMVVLYREGMPSILYLILFATIALFILALMYNPSHVVIALFFLGILLLINGFKDKMYYLMGFLSWSALSFLGVYYGYTRYVLMAYALTLIIFSGLHWRKGRYQLVRSLVPLIILGSMFTYSANYGFHNYLKSHQQDRLNVWLRPELCDPHGSLYNVLQSKLAIGSGGLQGKGFLEGTMTKLNYVPEQSTDFIFCTIGEEQGFIGSFGIIILFFLLISRIIFLAERQKSDFSRLYAYGVAGILFLHFFVNIGMTMGLVPIIGIPLPFISYGGSALMSFTLMLGVLLKLDANHLNY